MVFATQLLLLTGQTINFLSYLFKNTQNDTQNTSRSYIPNNPLSPPSDEEMSFYKVLPLQALSNIALYYSLIDEKTWISLPSLYSLALYTQHGHFVNSD